MESAQSSVLEINTARPGFPIRLRPDALRRIVHKILTKSEGEQDGWGRVARFLESVEEAQREKLCRRLEPDERRQLHLITLRDARLALLALASDLRSGAKPSDTQLRRGKNVPYLLWRVEKEILVLHWGIDMMALEDRQRQSGLRMPTFLEESFEAEGL